MKSIYDTLLLEKPTRLLVELYSNEGESYTSVLTKNIDSTFSHTKSILGKLEHLELITIQNSRYDKRKNNIVLTPKGERVSKLLFDMVYECTHN